MAPNTPFKSEQPAARDEPATAQGAAIAIMGVKTGIMNGAAEGLETAEPKPDSFEAFAKAIQSVATLKAAQVSICFPLRVNQCCKGLPSAATEMTMQATCLPVSAKASNLQAL